MIKLSVIKLSISVSDGYYITEGQSYYRSCSSSYYLDITYGYWYCSYSGRSTTTQMDIQCNYQSSCTIYASNGWLGGDPCPGTGKGLLWYDTCRCKYMYNSLYYYYYYNPATKLMVYTGISVRQSVRPSMTVCPSPALSFLFFSTPLQMFVAFYVCRLAMMS
jgi:hypothetical protein